MDRSIAVKVAVSQATEFFGVGVDVEGVQYSRKTWHITVSFQRPEQADVHLNHLFGLPKQFTTRFTRVYKVVEVPDWPEDDVKEDDRKYVIRNLDE